MPCLEWWSDDNFFYAYNAKVITGVEVKWVVDGWDVLQHHITIT